MSREVHVRFCEGPKVKLLRPTHPYIWTVEGWLYVAAVTDLFSRRVVGWSMKAEMTAQLVADAFVMAIWRRGRPDVLLHHSDSQRIEASFRAVWLAGGHCNPPFFRSK